MIIHNCEQRSETWNALRLGKITGTRLANVFKADNLTLCDELIAETITGEAEPFYENAAMRWGIDMEPEAKAAYMKATGLSVEDVGFIQHNTLDYFGMSPDGLIVDAGLSNLAYKAIEIKCPTTKTHVKYIRQNQVPNEYKYQVFASFLINEAQESHDFVSYDPRFKLKPLLIVTTNRADIEKELEETMTGLLKFREKWKALHEKIIF